MLAVHSLELVLGRMQGRLPAGARTIEVKADFVPRSSCAAPVRSAASKSVTR
jgi:LacI family transcriptional regulator